MLAAGALGEGPARGGTTSGTALWILEAAGLQSSPGAPNVPIAVGSLQKPFVAEAWARTHAGAAPRFTCRGGSSCWLRSGHGSLGLARAVALSCNAYFRELALEVAPDALASVLREEGFRVAGPLSPDAAIGLDTPPGTVTVAPEALLRAYVRLTRRPWPAGEPTRAEVLHGMRASAQEGTAKALDHRGYFAKTGTVGRPGSARTVGFALAVDDSGWAMLARLEPGTGREAAAALGARIERERPWSVRAGAGAQVPEEASSPRGEGVRVRMLERLRGRRVLVRNMAAAPAAAGGGFVGPGATLTMRPGDRAARSTWEIRVPEVGLVRVLHCALVREDDVLLADMDRREYASGVIAAELPDGDAARRVELGAAVLRFLARGPRHRDADVCDSTHCAFFIGRGPRTIWTSPTRATAVGGPLQPLDDVSWSEVQSAARDAGPDQWTSHCGGQPLSAHAVWGGGDRSVKACAVHGPADSRRWSRSWSASELSRAFGGTVRSLRVRVEDGVWGLEVDAGSDGPRLLLYDDAHRRLAAALGWGALPSPAEGVYRALGGWRAEGVGLGHRVGLCLGPQKPGLALLAREPAPAP